MQTVLNGSFARVADKPQPSSFVTVSTRNGKSNESLNQTIKHDASLPVFNNSFGVTGRLNQTTGQYHHRGAAATTARTLRRERARDGSVKSTSRERDSSHNQYLYQPHSSSSPTGAQQHGRSRSIFAGMTYDNYSRGSAFPMKATGNARRRSARSLSSVVEALMYHGDALTEFERAEILEYNEVYFLGLEVEKLPARELKDYDDENGSYIKVNKDHICYRFEIVETLGKGSFGLVLRCYDHKKKEMVALKIIRNKKRFQQQGLVEVNLLAHLKALDADNALNVVHIQEHFYFRSHLCITFEILG